MSELTIWREARFPPGEMSVSEELWSARHDTDSGHELSIKRGARLLCVMKVLHRAVQTLRLK